MAARRGDWPGAFEHAKHAAAEPGVDMEDIDRVIYGWLFSELAEHGYELAREAVLGVT